MKKTTNDDGFFTQKQNPEGSDDIELDCKGKQFFRYFTFNG